MAQMNIIRENQRGAIAIIVGLSLVVLVAFAGLALDLGRLYVNKTELQNAADACALAASRELTCSTAPCPASNLTNAQAAGIYVAGRDNRDFQSTAVTIAPADVRFSMTLAPNSSYVTLGGADPASKYVMCIARSTGIVPWFMGVLGIGAQDVNATAVATLTHAQTNCAIPMALCSNGASPPDFGYVLGQWYSMNFDENSCSGTSCTGLTGNFRWIDFDPSSSTPGCSGGGAQELACVFKGTGQCNLPPPNPATACPSGSGSGVPGCVGQTGNINSLGFAFNTRFGIYHGSDNMNTAPPDYTGLAYTPATWPLGHDAYNGTSTGHNFLDARAANDPVQASEVPHGSSAVSTSDLQTHGADRRLVTLPVVDCSSFVGSQQAPIQAYVCILLVRPYTKTGSTVTVTAEYRGASDMAGSACATSGTVGGPGSVGPQVPALVQ